MVETELPGWVSRHGDVMHLAIKASPKAGQDAIGGISTDVAGRHHLEIRIKAAPENGKATRGVTRLLAKRLGIAKTRLTPLSGTQSRYKRYAILGIDAALASALVRLDRLVRQR